MGFTKNILFFGLFFMFFISSTFADISQKGPFNSVGKSLVSRDGTGLGYVYNKEGKFYFFGNTKTYGPFASIDVNSLQFTNEGNSFGFTATNEGKQFVIINANQYGPYDSVTDFKFETTKSNTFSFKYTKDNNSYINLNGKSHGPYQLIEKVSFSQDGLSYGFTYKKGEKSYININGEEFGESYDWAGDVRIAVDGGKFGFAYKKGDKYYVNVNKKEYGPFDQYNQDNLKLSQDGTKFIFSYVKDAKSFLVINGVEFGGYASIGNIFSSLDYKNNIFTYVVQTTSGGLNYLNYNGKVFGPYLSIDKVTLSQDGIGFAFVYDIAVQANDANNNVITKNEKYVNISGIPYKVVDGINMIDILVSEDKIPFGYKINNHINQEKYFYIDGKEFGPFFKINKTAYLLGKWAVSVTDKELSGKDYVYIQGKQNGPFDEGEVENILFSSDKVSYLYNYQIDDKRYINISGKDFGPYEQLDAIKFSLDGKGVSYRYAIGDKWYIKLNDKDYGPYDRSDYLNYLPDGVTYNFRFEKGGKRYINFNGVEYGPYDSFIDLKFANKNPKGYGFIYKNNFTYAVINNKTFGPYMDISDLKLSEKIGHIFQYQSSGKKHVNYNGNKYGPCDEVKDLDISDNGETHIFSCMKEGKWYVITNDLSASDKLKKQKKDQLAKMVNPKMRPISKQKLETVLVKLGKIKSSYKNKKSNFYTQLELLYEIIDEEIRMR